MCREFPTIPTCLRLNNLSKPPISKMKISQKVYIYFMWMVLTSELPVKSCRVHSNLIKLGLHSSWHDKTLHNFFCKPKDYVYTKQKRCYTDWKSCQKLLGLQMLNKITISWIYEIYQISFYQKGTVAKYCWKEDQNLNWLRKKVVDW